MTMNYRPAGKTPGLLLTFILAAVVVLALIKFGTSEPAPPPAAPEKAEASAVTSAVEPAPASKADEKGSGERPKPSPLAGKLAP